MKALGRKQSEFAIELKMPLRSKCQTRREKALGWGSTCLDPLATSGRHIRPNHSKGEKVEQSCTGR